MERKKKARDASAAVLENDVEIFGTIFTRSRFSMPKDKTGQLSIFILLNCLRYQIVPLNIEDFRWKIDYDIKVVHPVWLTGNQLPNSLIRGNSESKS